MASPVAARPSPQRRLSACGPGAIASQIAPGRFSLDVAKLPVAAQQAVQAFDHAQHLACGHLHNSPDTDSQSFATANVGTSGLHPSSSVKRCKGTLQGHSSSCPSLTGLADSAQLPAPSAFASHAAQNPAEHGWPAGSDAAQHCPADVDPVYDVNPVLYLSRAYTAPAATGPDNSSSRMSLFPPPRACPTGLDRFGSFAAALMYGDHCPEDLAAVAAGYSIGDYGDSLLDTAASDICEYLVGDRWPSLDMADGRDSWEDDMACMADDVVDGMQHISSQPVCLLARRPCPPDSSLSSSCDDASSFTTWYSKTTLHPTTGSVSLTACGSRLGCESSKDNSAHGEEHHWEGSSAQKAKRQESPLPIGGKASPAVQIAQWLQSTQAALQQLQQRAAVRLQAAFVCGRLGPQPVVH